MPQAQSPSSQQGKLPDWKTWVFNILLGLCGLFLFQIYDDIKEIKKTQVEFLTEQTRSAEIIKNHQARILELEATVRQILIQQHTQRK